MSNLVCPTFPNLQTHRYHPDEEITQVTLDYIKAFGKTNNTFFLTVGFFRPDIPYRFPFKFISKLFTLLMLCFSFSCHLKVIFFRFSVACAMIMLVVSLKNT